MKELNYNHFVFYKLCFYLTKNCLLDWKDIPNKYKYKQFKCKLIDQVSLEIEYNVYPDSTSRFDFRLSYSYRDIEHKEISKSISEFLKSHDSLYRNPFLDPLEPHELKADIARSKEDE